MLSAVTVEISAVAVELSPAIVVAVELSAVIVVAVELSPPATVVGATVVSSPYKKNIINLTLQRREKKEVYNKICKFNIKLI